MFVVLELVKGGSLNQFLCDPTGLLSKILKFQDSVELLVRANSLNFSDIEKYKESYENSKNNLIK